MTSTLSPAPSSVPFSQLCVCEKCGTTEGALSKAFIIMVNLLMLRKCAVVNHGVYPKDYGKLLVNGPKIDFDFIIIGAGTAGTVVARGLTDNSAFRVLILEAGELPSESSYIHFDKKKDPPRARCVEAIINGENFKIQAKKEIILAAGAINTPKILMLSGIGRCKHLMSVGIDPIADIGVGENLQTQISLPIFVSINTKWDSVTPETDFIDDAYQYIMYRRGRWAKINVNGIVGSINTEVLPYDYPTIKINHFYFRKRSQFFPIYLTTKGFVAPIIKSLKKLNQRRSIMLFIPTLIKPKSRGKVFLNCTDPTMANPIVMGNFFSDENNEDFETMLAGFRYINKLIRRPSYRTYNATLMNIDMPMCRNFKYCSDAWVRCLVRTLAYPQTNVAGTAKMGTECEHSVVDELLQVKGVQALRVVDASVMPEIVCTNTQPTEAVIAERAVDFLKRRWIKRYTPMFKTTTRPCDRPPCECERVTVVPCATRP